MGQITKENIAECVGLWLAEGGNKSKSEITFTNTCVDLLDLFKKTINHLFRKEKYNQRIYVYSKEGKQTRLKYKDCFYKNYVHKRATRPFYIYRVASVRMIKEWNLIVKDYLAKSEYYPSILRGFFAGEGNIHGGKRGVRTLRIAQKMKKAFIDSILDQLSLKHSFYALHRYYFINGKHNWDVFAKYKIADLHPIKKEKFWKFYNSYKEEHYENNYLKNEIFKILDKPKTARELSIIFNRSQARISEVLVMLKKEGKIDNYRIRSIDYWTNDRNLILISKIKDKYLNLLSRERTTMELARHFNVDWKSSFRRLKELEKLGLVNLNESKMWQRMQTEREIWVI